MIWLLCFYWAQGAHIAHQEAETMPITITTSSADDGDDTEARMAYAMDRAGRFVAAASRLHREPSYRPELPRLSPEQVRRLAYLLVVEYRS